MMVPNLDPRTFLRPPSSKDFFAHTIFVASRELIRIAESSSKGQKTSMDFTSNVTFAIMRHAVFGMMISRFYQVFNSLHGMNP